MELLDRDLGLMDLATVFNDADYCYKYLEHIKWGDTPYCSYCADINVTRLNGKRAAFNQFQCNSKGCRRVFNIFTNTPMNNTKITKQHWLFIIYFFASNKKTTSSRQLSKNMHITQATAWGIMNKIRPFLKDKPKFKLRGTVEVDEVFLAKGCRWTRWGGITTRKEPILGMIERGGRVITMPIQNRNQATLEALIGQHVEKGSTVYTDGHAGYNKLHKNYEHDYVNHSSHEYVRGEVHTNTIEGFWSFLKRGIKNGHHSVSSKHSQAYIDEAAYKYNYRNERSIDKFHDILSRVLCNYSPLYDKL